MTDGNKELKSMKKETEYCMYTGEKIKKEQSKRNLEWV